MEVSNGNFAPKDGGGIPKNNINASQVSLRSITSSESNLKIVNANSDLQNGYRERKDTGGGGGNKFTGKSTLPNAFG